MSLAENLLNSLDDYKVTEANGVEEEPHIIVGSDRVITVPAKLKLIAVKGDKDVETVSFDCVRYWDEHDLSTFAIYINYVLPDLTSGTYIPKAIAVDADDKNVFHFDWEIKNYMTQLDGGIIFAVSAIKTDSDGNIQHRWSSLQNYDFVVAKGLDVNEIPNDVESSAVLSQMSEILSQLQQTALIGEIVQTVGNSGTAVMSQKAVTRELNEIRTVKPWNLLDGCTFKEQWFGGTDGVGFQDSRFFVVENVPLQEGTIIVIYSDTGYYNTARAVSFFDINNNVVGGIDENSTLATDGITVPTGCVKANITFNYVTDTIEKPANYYVCLRDEEKTDTITLNKEIVIPQLQPIEFITDNFIGNMIENAEVLENTFIRDSGELVTPAMDFFTVIIPCKANTDYKLVFDLARFITYYNGETLISGHDYGAATNLDTVITTPENCNFVKITGYYHGNPGNMVKNMEQKYFGTGVNILKYDRLAPSIKVNMLNMPLDYIDTCNQRKACISFIFDDGTLQDSEIHKAFVDCGFACGFALPTSISESEYERYKKYYSEGFSILSHSTDGNGFSDTTLTLYQASEKFKQSRKTLESKGFKISGWVTPSSQMDDIYIPSLEGYYSYGFTQYYYENTETAPPYNTITDRPWRLKRRYLGTSLDNLKSIAQDAVDHQGYLTFYYHSRDLGTDMTVDTLKEFLNWLAVYTGSYDLEVLPPDLAIRYYYRKRVWE